MGIVLFLSKSSNSLLTHPLLEEKTLSELKDLVSNFRNEAAHERSFNQKELEFVRSKTFKFLKMILGIRVV